MKLIIGLGNVGPEYSKTRHNIGFTLLDYVVEEFGLSWQEKPKFKAHIAETRIGTERIIFAKPTTFYNLSGEAVRAIADFYKIDSSDILVLHDELALPLGVVRTRIGGSDAGNNGIKNISQHMGEDYARIRVGVSGLHLSQQDAKDFVLGKFSPQEQQKLLELPKHTLRFVEDFIHEDKEFLHTSVRLT